MPGRPSSDAVVLLPGFLGIDRVGRFFYFSERVAAALRAALEARSGRTIVVVPCSNRPIGSLQARQAFLLEQLARICQRERGLERIHLVGHSTGGLDAQLLTCDRPLGEGSWGPFSWVRSRIASAVAIAAPQHGTYLARSTAVRLLQGRLSLSGAASVTMLSVDLIHMLWTQPAVRDILDGARTQLPETIAFLAEMLRHRELLRDLDPDSMAALRQRVKPEGRVPLTSFVTVAGLSEAAPRAPDRFFRDLHELTASETLDGRDAAAAAVERLRRARHWISGTGRAPGLLGARSSDGVVNSALQLFDPGDPRELGGVVVADHADVIGYYDRPAGPLERRPLQEGMFHSGSGFNDRCFFELYGRVAQAICRSIPDLDDSDATPVAAG